MSLLSKIAGTVQSQSVIDALSRSLAIIEFDPSGKVLTANPNFCKALGYEAEEIVGRHHSLFVESEYARSQEYKEFWAKLGRGEFDAREYKRIGKGGREIWIQASYNPVFDSRGKVAKVVKVATDITAEKLKAAETQGKMDAISRVQGVIEFTTDGNVITANKNFLGLLGYGLDEIQGRHHRMFVDPTYASSNEYREFWSRLNKGEYLADEFRRIGKGGKEIWIQASYNPIFDLNGRVMKVVKFATDVTERVRDVRDIGAALGRLAEGDLAGRIDRPFIPALERLRTDFNAAVDRLDNTLGDVVHRAEAMRAGTNEIATAADDLAKRTEQQAASLEETSAAVQEITAAVKSSANGAAEAHQLASAAKTDAQSGGEVVRMAVEAMQRIEKSSRDIGQIIGTIDEIAFQTNLLALNAGVEAARAGEAGRGFAVVASEVRALAQRSAEAAKEIKALILSSTSEVNEGANLVSNAGQALERIVAQVLEINEVVAAISSSAAEQSSSLQQVNSAVAQMDQDTQRNAAMVEQTTAASHSLRTEAAGLAQSVRKFKISGAERPGDNVIFAPVRPQKAPPLKGAAPRSRGGALPKAAHDIAADEWAEF